MIVIKKQLKNNNHFLMLGNCTNPNDKKYRILYFKKVGKKIEMKKFEPSIYSSSGGGGCGITTVDV